MSNPRIGVIGIGRWGKNHVNTLAELGFTPLAYDPLINWGVASVEALIYSVDAVVIATPPSTHFDLAIQCLQAGKDVLIEKPMALSSVQANILTVAAELGQRVLMVGHLMRYHQGFLALQQKVAGLPITDIFSVRRQPKKPIQHATPLWSLAPHDISMILALAGMPESVSATCDTNTAYIELNYGRGLVGKVFVDWNFSHVHRKFNVNRTIEMDQEDPNALRTELLHFINCVTLRLPPLTSGLEGERVVRVLEAADKSGGKKVWL